MGQRNWKLDEATQRNEARLYRRDAISGKFSAPEHYHCHGYVCSHGLVSCRFVIVSLPMLGSNVSGAVIDKNVEPMLIMEYMDHGSLYDILHNETMVLGSDILMPILCDVIAGIRFLHSSDPPCIHGDLKAQNILVDGKFRAKVADFGLSQKKNIGGTGTPFWIAPELLRGESSNTTCSDIYSFGIVLYEAFSRKDPYDDDEEDGDEVLRQVADPTICKRPPFPPSAPEQVHSIMADCFANDPKLRPSATEIGTRMERIEGKDSQENKSSSVSLFDIFPHHVAVALRDGRPVEAEHKDCVTIFFSDIVGFTTISSNLEPRKVAALLDRLYSKLDALSVQHDIFKVRRIVMGTSIRQANSDSVP